MNDQNAILSKIKKLQALTTERGASPEEAASAAAKAQALLFEYNLSQADVETKEHAPDPYGKVEHTLAGANRSTVTWRRGLLYTIAKHNWCSAVTLPNSTKMNLVGKRSNVETVLYLNEILVREIERLAIDAARTVLSNRQAYMVSFCRGAVSIVHQRLAMQQREDTQQATTSTTTNHSRNAVAIRTAGEELNKAIAHFYPGGLSHRTTRSRIGSSDGYAAGQQAGRGLSMHRGIGQTRRPSALIG
jgi:hypothetical protein